MADAPVVFLDVDTQRDFLLAEGAAPVPGGLAVVPIIQRLVSYAFVRGVPVVSSLDSHPPDDPEFVGLPAHCVRGTRGQLKIDGTTLGNALYVPNLPDRTPDAEAVAAARQIIVEKQTLSLFDNPHAEGIFRVLSPRLVVAFGAATDYAVRADVVGVCARGYRTAVVSDAIVGLSERASQEALREMRRAGATFIRAADIIAKADPNQLTW
jgi:nicotinamidase/pyrazinamidase